MIVHAAPKTQPGGVQGALFKFKYQSVIGPLFMSQLPNARPPKLIVRNKSKKMLLFFIQVHVFLTFQSDLKFLAPLGIFDHYLFG